MFRPLLTGLLLFFYSLGNFVPLFLFSVFYDKFNLSESKLIKGKMFKFSVLGKKFNVHSTNLISGPLFILIGAILVIFKGTSIFNTWDFFKTKQYFYSFQNMLIEWKYANVLGIVVFGLFVVIVGRFLWKNKRRNNS